jgi:hypothetical protein
MRNLLMMFRIPKAYFPIEMVIFTSQNITKVLEKLRFCMLIFRLLNNSTRSTVWGPETLRVHSVIMPRVIRIDVI